MQAIRLSATISAERELTIKLPEGIRPGRVEVLILREDEQPVDNTALLALIEELAEQAESGQSVEALNERLESERSSWE